MSRRAGRAAWLLEKPQGKARVPRYIPFNSQKIRDQRVEMAQKWQEDE